MPAVFNSQSSLWVVTISYRRAAAAAAAATPAKRHQRQLRAAAAATPAKRHQRQSTLWVHLLRSKPSKALLQLTDQKPEAQGVALLGVEAAAMAVAVAVAMAVAMTAAMAEAMAEAMAVAMTAAMEDSGSVAHTVALYLRNLNNGSNA